MPQVILGDKHAQKKPADAKNAVVKAKKGSEARQIPVAALIGAAVLSVLLILFLVNKYVTRIVPQGPAYTKVTPPPGYPDEFPYNTKEWQQQGGARPLSGMPPPALMKQWKGQGAQPSSTP